MSFSLNGALSKCSRSENASYIVANKTTKEQAKAHKYRTTPHAGSHLRTLKAIQDDLDSDKVNNVQLNVLKQVVKNIRDDFHSHPHGRVKNTFKLIIGKKTEQQQVEQLYKEIRHTIKEKQGRMSDREEVKPYHIGNLRLIQPSKEKIHAICAKFWRENSNPEKITLEQLASLKAALKEVRDDYVGQKVDFGEAAKLLFTGRTTRDQLLKEYTNRLREINSVIRKLKDEGKAHSPRSMATTGLQKGIKVVTRLFSSETTEEALDKKIEESRARAQKKAKKYGKEIKVPSKPFSKLKPSEQQMLEIIERYNESESTK